MVTLSPPTSEAGVRSLAVGRKFTVQNPNKLYVLVSSALPATRHDILYSVESDVKPQINK